MKNPEYSSWYILRLSYSLHTIANDICKGRASVESLYNRMKKSLSSTFVNFSTLSYVFEKMQKIEKSILLRIVSVSINWVCCTCLKNDLIILISCFYHVYPSTWKLTTLTQIMMNYDNFQFFIFEETISPNRLYQSPFWPVGNQSFVR